VLIREIANAGALPVLGVMLNVAGQRQRLLAHNIANIDTPDFRPLDVNIGEFQKALARAVEVRRAEGGGGSPLPLSRTREVNVEPDGSVTLRPRTHSGNILYHDRNDRDVEQLMQNLAENALAFRLTADLIRRENDLLRTAISQRV
jgi:flagellar basal-body rod protein FlgB